MIKNKIEELEIEAELLKEAQQTMNPTKASKRKFEPINIAYETIPQEPKYDINKIISGISATLIAGYEAMKRFVECIIELGNRALTSIKKACEEAVDFVKDSYKNRNEVWESCKQGAVESMNEFGTKCAKMIKEAEKVLVKAGILPSNTQILLEGIKSFDKDLIERGGKGLFSEIADRCLSGYNAVTVGFSEMCNSGPNRNQTRHR